MPSELDAFVASKEITIAARHIQLATDKEWSHDEWGVQVIYKGKKYWTSYKTGLGHRTPRAGVRKEHGGYTHGNGNFERTIEGAIRANMLQPHAPSVGDVVHSLCSDASSANESFESWCGNVGYSDDSIKALNTYRACQQTRDALLKLFGRELFEELSSKEH